jgi:transposase
MGLSRRMFTKEFKLAAVQRLEQGVSLGEVARALEVNPNVLHRWRREIRQGPGNVFPGKGKQRWSEGRVADLERKIGRNNGWEAMSCFSAADRCSPVCGTRSCAGFRPATTARW